MSQKLQKHEEFTAEEKTDLFKLSFLTARKQCVSTQSKSESETSTKKSTEKFNSNKSLFKMLTKTLNMTMMNLFEQEQNEESESRFEELQQNESSRFQENSRSKSSLLKMIFQQ